MGRGWEKKGRKKNAGFFHGVDTHVSTLQSQLKIKHQFKAFAIFSRVCIFLGFVCKQ